MSIAVPNFKFLARTSFQSAALIAFVASAACTAETAPTPETTEGLQQPEVASVGPTFGVPHEAGLNEGVARGRIEAKAIGGTGGHWERITCSNLTGIQGRSWSLVDALGFVCDGQFSTALAGGAGGRWFSDRCPTGWIATGFYGGAGAYVDRIGLVCHDPNNVELWSKTGTYGGPGGSGFWWECPAGQKLIGADLNVGAYVDGIQPLCGWR